MVVTFQSFENKDIDGRLNLSGDFGLSVGIYFFGVFFCSARKGR